MMSQSASSEGERFYASDPDYSPEPCTSSSQRRRGLSQRRIATNRGQRLRGRGRGTRGRGTRGRGRGTIILDQDDARRAEILMGLRIADEQARIQTLNLEECRQLLQRCLSREPSMMYDLLHITSANAPAPGTQVSNQLSWCVCNNCRDMPTDLECKCCGQQPEACISILPHMAAYILQEGHLRLASRIWNDVRGLDDLPNRGESSKQLRHAAYRQYVMWQYGALGRGNRVVIPSCVVWKIRDCFPDVLGHYTGYIPGRVQ